ncbi:MAG: hypothetical protein ACRES9_05595 [Gammaproteobacteria bacterium]
MILFLSTAILSLACASTARADSWVELGLEAWNTQISGNLSFPKSAFPNESVGFRDDLNMGRRWNPNFYFIWHNSGPFLPDLRVEYGTLLADGENSGDLCFDGTHFRGDIKGQVALKLARVLFYWNPVDNSLINLRAGVDFRWVSLNTAATGAVQANRGGSSTCPVSPGLSGETVGNGEGSPTQTATFRQSKSAGVVTWLPEADLGVTVHLPAHFDILFEGSGVPYASSYLYDFRLGFEYHFASGLIFSAGYRRWRLHLDNSDWSVKGDLDFKGPYATVSWRF